MPGYKGRSRRGLISLIIERSIAICLWLPATRSRQSRTSDTISAWVVLRTRRFTARSLPRTAFSASVVPDPAFVRLLSFLHPENKVPSHTQLASLLANRHERAKEETKCLLRAQATVGMALTNDGSTLTTTKFVCDPIVCDAQSSLYGSRKSAVEQRSRNSFLQREMHSGELGGCFPGCSEKIWAVDGPLAKGVSESYRDEAAIMVAAGKLRD